MPGKACAVYIARSIAATGSPERQSRRHRVSSARM